MSRAAGVAVAALLVVSTASGCKQGTSRNGATPPGEGSGALGGNTDQQTRCPMCGRPWAGGYPSFREIPESLPKPDSAEWVGRLREVLAREELSKRQYVDDSRRFGAHMPYAMVIPQEDQHLAWLRRLFAAYGLPADGEVLQLRPTADLEQAYRTAMELEQELMPRYEWLIANSGEEQTRRVLDRILLETRMHFTMFDHALRMGGMGMGMRRGSMPGPGGP